MHPPRHGASAGAPVAATPWDPPPDRRCERGPRGKCCRPPARQPAGRAARRGEKGRGLGADHERNSPRVGSGKPSAPLHAGTKGGGPGPGLVGRAGHHAREPRGLLHARCGSVVTQQRPDHGSSARQPGAAHGACPRSPTGYVSASAPGPQHRREKRSGACTAPPAGLRLEWGLPRSRSKICEGQGRRTVCALRGRHCQTRHPQHLADAGPPSTRPSPSTKPHFERGRSAEAQVYRSSNAAGCEEGAGGIKTYCCRAIHLLEGRHGRHLTKLQLANFSVPLIVRQSFGHAGRSACAALWGVASRPALGHCGLSVLPFLGLPAVAADAPPLGGGGGAGAEAQHPICVPRPARRAEKFCAVFIAMETCTLS